MAPKGSDAAQSAPKVIDTARFISSRAKLWKPSAIRSLYPLEKKPGMISLLAGKPNASTFPFESILIKLKSPASETLTIQGQDLEEALQYVASAGIPRLVAWLVALQQHAHRRGDNRQEGWRLSLATGSQDLIHKCFEILTDAGDYVLMETPAYSGTLGAIATMGLKLIEVPVDDDGLDPAKLERMLDDFETTHPGAKRPKLLYTIPCGSNPTGASAPESRKRELLRLAKKHDLIILEDDPYYWLYVRPSLSLALHAQYGEEQRPRSLFSLEPEVNGEVGRVVRLDSASKIISSGMRIGWVTGPVAICDQVDLITASTNMQSSSTTQAIFLQLVQNWDIKGWEAHCARVADFYRSQRDMFHAAATRHLEGIATWVKPVSGMFLWIRFLDIGEPADSFALIRTEAVAKGIVAVPGVAFMPSGSASDHVRVSFSLITEDDADEAMRRLREVILDAQAKAKAK